jgi:hypothetical protein
VRAVAEGTGPDGEAMVAVNLRCAENRDLSTIKITQFDGASLYGCGGTDTSSRSKSGRGVSALAG